MTHECVFSDITVTCAVASLAIIIVIILEVIKIIRVTRHSLEKEVDDIMLTQIDNYVDACKLTGDDIKKKLEYLDKKIAEKGMCL